MHDPLNNPITWNDYINVRLVWWAGGVILTLIFTTLADLYELREDRHANDESEMPSKNAGKTLFKEG